MFDSDIGLEIILFLNKYPVLWPLAAILCWVYVIKPFIRPYQEEKLNKTKIQQYNENPSSASESHTDEKTNDYVFTQEQYDSLYERTQQAWLNGKLGKFEPNAKDAAADLSIIKKHLKKHDAALLFAFKDQAPDEDEYLVAVFDGGVRTSFVVTNKYFYFFSLDVDMLANKYETGKVEISAIEKIESSKGMLMHKMTLYLKSSEQLLVKDLVDDYPIRYINYRLEEQM